MCAVVSYFWTGVVWLLSLPVVGFAWGVIWTIARLKRGWRAMPPWALVLTLSLSVAAVLLVGVFFNWIQAAYAWAWTNTTGEPWTFIMRRFPYALVVPAMAILAVAARWLPNRFWGRIVFMWIVLWIGLISGHVFW